MQRNMLFNLGSVNDIPLGQGRCFIVKGEEIAVFRSRNGDISAIENKCPHREGPLAEGMMGNGLVVCPLHGHKFDLGTGQGSEHNECIQIYNVLLQHGEMILEFPCEIFNQKKENNASECLTL